MFKILESPAITRIVSALAAIALAVSLVAAGFAACAVPDVSTKLLAGAFSDDADSPFTKDELVAAAVQTKRYTIDDNDKAAAYATVAAINAQQQLTGASGKGAPELPDDAIDYASAPLSFEQVTQLEASFEAASERYVLTPDAMSHLDDVYRVVQASKPWLLAAVVAAAVCCTAVGFRAGKRGLGFVFTCAGASIIAIFALLAAWVAVDFDGFFAIFHSLFFAQGTWTFSWDSLLICMYPPEFWMGMGAIWLGVTVVCCAACLIMGRLLRKGSTQSA